MSETSKSQHNASLLPQNPPCRIHIQLHPVLHVKAEMCPSCKRRWGGQQQQGFMAEQGRGNSLGALPLFPLSC